MNWSDDDVARFWSKVDKTGTDGCWLWVGSIDSSGYGQIKIKGRQVLAHRMGFMLSGQTIEPGKPLDHLCRVRHCVNPTHLESVTARENTLRGMGPAGVNARKTHCKRGHPFDDDNTGMQAKGRYCKACYVAWLAGRRKAA